MGTGQLHIAGCGLSAAGAALAAYGAMLQAHGYCAFPLRELAAHVWRVVREFARGRDAARAYLDRTRQLARLAGEKRTRPFLGLHGVLAGFFQPLAGNVFSLAAPLRGDAK